MLAGAEDPERMYIDVIMPDKIELNMKYPEENTELLLRPYVIAKECGCKFYLGSDAHTSHSLDHTVANFEKIVSALSLDESDKFHLS